MHSIPLNLKQLLFNKGDKEPLNSEEQTLWEDFVTSEQPQNALVDPDEPIFRDALKLYERLKEEDIVSWKNLEHIILQQASSIKFNNPKKKRGVLKWLIYGSVAAAILIGVICLWLKLPIEDSSPIYLTKKTLKDQMDTVNLPDGSKVWLNRGSSIKYPTRFNEKERRIELIGEAFFKVKTIPAVPFRVVAGKSEVIALGTEFNVKAYPEDTAVTTTLKEGTVQIKHGTRTQEINPGEQAVAYGDSICRYKDIKLAKELAWGFITLEGQTLKSVMEQIKSSYNVDYSIRGNPQPIDLTDQIPKTHSLKEVIQILNDAAEKTQFHLVGHTVIVSEIDPN